MKVTFDVDIDDTNGLVCEVLKTDAKMLERDIKKLGKQPDWKKPPYSEDLEYDKECLGAMRVLMRFYGCK